MKMKMKNINDQSEFISKHWIWL